MARYAIDKLKGKDGYVYPYSEALMKKKGVEEISEEKALEFLKAQQAGDVGFRASGDNENAEVSATDRLAQLEVENAKLKAEAKAKEEAEAKAEKPEPTPAPAEKTGKGK